MMFRRALYIVNRDRSSLLFPGRVRAGLGHQRTFLISAVADDLAIKAPFCLSSPSSMQMLEPFETTRP